jgi:hypothetical protein
MEIINEQMLDSNILQSYLKDSIQLLFDLNAFVSASNEI